MQLFLGQKPRNESTERPQTDILPHEKKRCVEKNVLAEAPSTMKKSTSGSHKWALAGTALARINTAKPQPIGRLSRLGT